MLAAVTCLFSPDAQRLRNYVYFAAHLAESQIPLYTVAAGRDEDPNASTAHTFRYRLADDQILWQKERLLNLAVARLPADVDVIAWLDADLIFDCDHLAQAFTHAARIWPVAQCWQYATMCGPDYTPDSWPGGVQRAESIAAYHYQRKNCAIDPSAGHPGFAWLMRREIWDAIGGLYEYDLAGIADGLMAAAWLGAGPYNPYLRTSPDTFRRHALAWCHRADSVIQGQVGYVPIALGHLYHGAVCDRNYRARREQLIDAAFSPENHVAADPGQPLHWTATAPSSIVAFSASWLAQ